MYIYVQDFIQSVRREEEEEEEQQQQQEQEQEEEEERKEEEEELPEFIRYCRETGIHQIL